MKPTKSSFFEELWNNPKFLRIFVPGVLLTAIFWRKIKPVLTGKITWEEVLRSLPDSFWIGASSFLGLLLLGAGMVIGNWIRLRKKAAKEEKWIRILPSRSIPWDKENILSWVQSFGEMGRRRFWWLKGNPWFRFRIVLPLDSKEIALYLGYPAEREESVWNTIRERYPSAEIYRLAKEEVPVPGKGGKGGTFWFRGISSLPLASLREKKTSPLATALSALRPGTYLELQFAPTGWSELEERTGEVYEVLQSKKAGELSTWEKASKQSLAKRFTGKEASFRVRLSVWSNHWKAGSVVSAVVNAIQTEMNHHGKVRLIRRSWNPILATSPVPLPIPFTIMSWSGDELANLFHLPEGESRIYDEPGQNEGRGFLPALGENQRTPEDWELSQGIRVGRIKHPIIERDIRIDEEQLTKHFLLTGAPGMGKSSLLVEMIDGIIREWIQDPDHHPGFTFIDPALETIAIIQNRLRYYEEVLGWKIPKHKIRYFDLTSSSTHPLALNLLHVPKGTPKNAVARTAADVILHTTGSSDLPRTKRLLRLTIHALLEDDQPHTILGIPSMLQDLTFRKRMIDKLKDPYLIREWKNIQSISDSEVEPILNRLDPLLSDPGLRRMYCQPKMSLNLRKYMDEGYLVFMNVKGMGQEEIRITVGHLIAQYHHAAKQRLAGSKLHLLLIDEAHLVQIPILAKIIAEDRKYALGLGLITQDLAQIRDSELVTALNLIGTVMSCAQNEGAMRVAKMTDGVFTESFIRRLPERNCAIFTRSKYQGRSHITTCVVENEPPVTYLPDGKIANFRNYESAEAQAWGLEWGRSIMVQQEEVEDARKVDEWIRRYMSEVGGEQIEDQTPKNPQKSGKYRYDKQVEIPALQQANKEEELFF